MPDTVYTVAFSGTRFLMVRNRKRGGWEMPGGHINPGESVKEAAVREFVEEAGYDVLIAAAKDTGNCWVCAGILGNHVSPNCEMESALFDNLPDNLAFDLEEYMSTVPWAYGAVGNIL